MKAIASMIWGVIPDKRQVIMTVLIVCLVLSAFGGVVVGVDIPFKEKTIAELWLDNHWENWRVHKNATDLFASKDKKDELKDECKELEQQIEKLEMTRWNLMGHPTLSANDKSIEIDKVLSRMGKAGKKLLAAEEALQAASHSYDLLVAQR